MEIHGSEIQDSVTTVCFIYLLYCAFQYWQRYSYDKSFGQKHNCLPMETWLPYKWPLALDVLKRQYDAPPDQRLLLFMSQYFDRVGPNMTFKLFGNQGYFTADPKNVESILSTNFEDWGLGSRRPGLMPMLGEGIFTQDGRLWKHSRELLRRQFVRIHHQDCRIFDEHIDDLIRELRFARGVVDIKSYVFRFTLSTTTALIFGESIVSLPGEETATFESAFDYASYISAIRLRLAQFEWVWKPPKFQEACAVVKDYADKFVQLALDDMVKNGEHSASETHAFIIDLYKELRDPVLVRDQLVHVLIAGRDTTAFTTGESSKITRALIGKMEYLRCVINESQRLYPQLPINVRQSVRTTMIPSGGGPDGKSPVLIPKGTGIGYSVYHMHRLKTLYGEDANSFRPDRWLGDELNGIGWGFMPFHGGPRKCLGRDFALTEASYAIIRIIQAFPGLRLPPELTVVPPGEEKQSLTLVVSSAEGCKVLLN
ncbi:cytochrome P450 [Aspergillus avenaceus]|uniref:Cytochrome P450 n=1 Tax=Aspergillus avenaceus TaxID=36643 RepID=A0A5N6TJ14_ASPAV|nr:cytochrome P450 [Aspergillus avenaceus]